MTLKNLTNKKILVYSLLLALIILIAPPLIRLIFFNGLLSGQEPYYHIRIAEYIADNNKIPSIDPLTKENYILIPYQLLLSTSTKLIGSYYSSIFLPILFGLLSIILVNSILNQLKIKNLEKFLILIILIISPIFIHLFSSSNQYFLPVFLLILGFCLFIQKRRVYFIISIPVFALLSIFNLPVSLFAISLILIYTINNKMKLRNFYIITAITIVLTLIYHSYIYNIYGLPQSNPFDKINLLQQFISDLGSPIGISIFSVSLAIFGMYILWEKRKQITAYILFFIFIALTLYSNYLIFYLNFITAVFAAHGLSKLISMKWSLKLIKNLTIAILFLGLLFSSVSYLQRATTQHPNQEIIESLIWLKNNSNKNSIIFSYPKNTHFINQIAERNTFIHQPFDYTKNLQNKKNKTYEIFYSRTLEKTKSNLIKNNITHILITPEMKSEIWSSKDQGLLFLFRNKETFKNIYLQNNIEIWEVINKR